MWFSNLGAQLCLFEYFYFSCCHFNLAFLDYFFFDMIVYKQNLFRDKNYWKVKNIIYKNDDIKIMSNETGTNEATLYPDELHGNLYKIEV